MARIRTVKPEMWKHEQLSALPEATHMLAVALLNYADDHGYFNANPALIRGELFPIREPSVSIPESLRSLQTINYIRLGTGPDGRRYGHIVHFSEHQRVSHPTDSKISVIAITWDDSGKIPEPSENPPETFRPEQGRERNREEDKERDKKEEDTANAVSPSKYAFESGCIRLTAKDLSKWEAAFTALDVRAELIGMTEWADQQGPKWFHAVAGLLAKRNRNAKLQVATGPPIVPAQTIKDLHRQKWETMRAALKESINRDREGKGDGGQVVRLLPDQRSG